MTLLKRRSEGRPIVGHLAVFTAWIAVAVWFGWHEGARRDALENAVTDVGSLDWSASPEMVDAVARLTSAAAEPDWTPLFAVALLIAFRSFYSAIGTARLDHLNARVMGMLGRA
jgi:hypothetical protein